MVAYTSSTYSAQLGNNAGIMIMNYMYMHRCIYDNRNNFPKLPYSDTDQAFLAVALAAAI